MLPRGRGGVAWTGAGGFAPVTERLLGNQLPGWTGSEGNSRALPGPHARNQPIGGELGRFDGASGTDPSRPMRSPYPRVVAPVVEGASGIGAGPALGAGLPAGAGKPLGYAYGQERTPGTESDGGSNAARLGRPGGDPLPTGRQGWWRGGIQGFNDQLQVRDRHAYWSKGRQRFRGPGTETQWNGRNPQLDGPPMAVLETVNISVNPQIGSPNTAFQDDLSRPYTWLGQQDGTRVPVWGGVPGLVIPYGSRGGVPYPIQDPTDGQGGPAMVASGPPHGLHSNTIPDGKQLQDRYKATPQMRPVRLDRPSNSTSAGQSYSQTVQFQGDTGPQGASRGSGLGLNFSVGGGWRGGGGG